jgi:hypothetical protein
MSTARVAHAPPVFRTGAFRTNSVTNPRDVSPEPRALNARREREKSSPRLRQPTVLSKAWAGRFCMHRELCQSRQRSDVGSNT